MVGSLGLNEGKLGQTISLPISLQSKLILFYLYKYLRYSFVSIIYIAFPSYLKALLPAH